jgi:hypothetical protein
MKEKVFDNLCNLPIELRKEIVKLISNRENGMTNNKVTFFQDYEDYCDTHCDTIDEPWYWDYSEHVDSGDDDYWS